MGAVVTNPAALAAEILPQVQAVSLRAANAGGQVAIQLCPVDSGSLQQSIGVVPLPLGGARVGCGVAGGKVPYDVYVVNGTWKMPARDFISASQGAARAAIR